RATETKVETFFALNKRPVNQNIQTGQKALLFCGPFHKLFESESRITGQFISVFFQHFRQRNESSSLTKWFSTGECHPFTKSRIFYHVIQGFDRHILSAAKLPCFRILASFAMVCASLNKNHRS